MKTAFLFIVLAVLTVGQSFGQSGVLTSQGGVFTPCSSPATPCTVQAAPQSPTNAYGGPLVVQGTPNGVQAFGSTTAGATVAMGANNPAVSVSPYNSTGGNAYYGGGISTQLGNDAIEGQGRYMNAYRLAADSTPGLVYCIIGHHTTGICTDPTQIPIGIMPPSNPNDNFVNPLGAGIWIQWGGWSTSVKSYGAQSFTEGDRVCTDTLYVGYVIDNGRAQCHCPSQQIGVSRQSDGQLNMHSIDIILGGCQ
jgi:hypothetical protein